MSRAFLLRFQEACLENTTQPHLGKGTNTRVAKEQPDTDPNSNAYTALAEGAESRGTTEHEDHLRGFIAMGTRTVTAVRTEGADSDPGQISNQILRR